MRQYAIIETDEGMTVTEVRPELPAEDVAAQHGGVVIDAGPFDSYQDAYDALLALDDEDDEEGAV
jgi:hypothetical protein